jgi:hypothetical protein
LLDSSIDAADKDVGSIESDGSREEPETSHHGQGVAKIEEGRNKIHNAELWEVKGQELKFITLDGGGGGGEKSGVTYTLLYTEPMGEARK